MSGPVVARDYDAHIGRWTSKDTMLPQNIGNSPFEV